MIEQEGSWQKYSSSKDEIRIGRSLESDLVIIASSNKVSRNHCTIRRVEESYFLCDLESPNGTFLNYSRLEPNKEYELYHQALITLGTGAHSAMIVFLIEDEFGEARITEAGRLYGTEK
jgi:pSer/pThr/pTyr-binding forkhead associated (FHA) protein